METGPGKTEEKIMSVRQTCYVRVACTHITTQHVIAEVQEVADEPRPLQHNPLEVCGPVCAWTTSEVGSEDAQG